MARLPTFYGIFLSRTGIIGGSIRCFEHLGEHSCTGNNTLEEDFEEVELCGGLNCRMKLERKFSKALLCLSNFRKLCSCSAVDDTVFSPPFSSVSEMALRFSSLESFTKRTSWSLIFSSILQCF